jgi:hypothetical protein
MSHWWQLGCETHVSDRKLQAILAKWANEGWDLVSVVRDEPPFSCTLFFHRPLPPPVSQVGEQRQP